jgi:hypothetical protein
MLDRLPTVKASDLDGRRLSLGGDLSAIRVSKENTLNAIKCRVTHRIYYISLNALLALRPSKDMLVSATSSASAASTQRPQELVLKW